jgi:hypothetical protein
LLDSLADVDISVVALSVDDEATTLDLIARHGLRFPVGHSADAAIAHATGAFVHPDPPYLQSTGFVLDPGGRVIVSVYSSGAIGRLVPRDVIGLVGCLREHAQASSGGIQESPGLDPGRLPARRRALARRVTKPARHQTGESHLIADDHHISRLATMISGGLSMNCDYQRREMIREA